MNFFKKLFNRNTNVRNIYHPTIKPYIKYSFTCKGVKYYSFSEDHKILAGRYFKATQFLRELGLCISQELLQEYLKLILKDLDQGKATKAAIKINEILVRSELAVEPETLYRIASAVYFDDSELLDGYDRKHNDIKIAAWKEAGQLDFFYLQPMSQYIDLSAFSQSDLKESLQEAGEYTRKMHQLMYEL